MQQPHAAPHSHSHSRSPSYSHDAIAEATASFRDNASFVTAPPEAGYQGRDISFILPNMESFNNWWKSVEEALTVDFVRGDKHSSRSTPRTFKEHVKMVCARHSRSGRKPYEKKHPERQRRVPSRKVGGDGCHAVISYRTFDDKDEVNVTYSPIHSHEIGAANWAFTREGRRQASTTRGKGRPGGPEHHTNGGLPAPHPSEPVDWLANTSNSLASNSQHGIGPVQRPTLNTGITFPAPDPSTVSPYSGSAYSPTSVSPPRLHGASPAALYSNGISMSPAVSPTSNASHTPAHPVGALPGTPAHINNGLPTPSRPVQSLPMSPFHPNSAVGLAFGTPHSGTHALPTPIHPTHGLPSASPITPHPQYPHSSYPYSTLYETLGGVPGQPSPVHYPPALPGSAHPTPAGHPQALSSAHPTPAPQLMNLSATPAVMSHELSDVSPAPMLLHMTPAHVTNGLPHTQTPLQITTDIPYTTEDLYPYDLSALPSGMDYDGENGGVGLSGLPSAGGLHPANGISLTVTSSPIPQPGQLDQGMSAAPAKQFTSPPPGPTVNTSLMDMPGILDLREDRLRRLRSMFDTVHSASTLHQLSEESVGRLEGTLLQLMGELSASAGAYTINAAAMHLGPHQRQ